MEEKKRRHSRSIRYVLEWFMVTEVTDDTVTIENVIGESITVLKKHIIKFQDRYVILNTPSTRHLYRTGGRRLYTENTIKKMAEIGMNPGYAIKFVNMNMNKHRTFSPRKESEAYREELKLWETIKAKNFKARMVGNPLTNIVNGKAVYIMPHNYGTGTRSVNAGVTDLVIPSYVDVIGNNKLNVHGGNIPDAKTIGNVHLSPKMQVITPGMLMNTRMDEVVIPEGIKHIRPHAFNSSTIRKLELPKSLTIVENNAFADMSKLETIKFNGPLKYLGDCAFLRCASLTELYVPNGIKSIGSRTFNGCCSLKVLRLPKSVKSLSYDTLYNINTLPLEKLIIPVALYESICKDDNTFVVMDAIKRKTRVITY